MKKITLLILILGLVSFISCKKDETKATIGSNPAIPALSVPGGASVVLLKTNKDSLITFTWTAANFGLQLVITYNVQMDKQGNDFKDAVSLGTVNNDLSLSIKTDNLNSKLLPMEFDPTKPDPISLEFRVQATVNSNVKAAISAVASQTITPYYVPIVYPILFVPGSYQGWHPEDSSTTIASVKSNDQYEGYIWFGPNSSKFKYTQKPNWDVNWGDNGGDGTLEPNGADIQAGEGGYYKLNVNLVALTHQFLRTTWGLIGDATPGGWDTDTDMTYDSIAKIWTVTLNLTANSVKFRANHAWDLNYGDTGADGALDPGGDNIAVPEAGNYTVTLNLSQPIYRYKLKKN